MNAFFKEIAIAFNKGDSMIRKLILINLAVFVLINLVKLSAFLFTGNVGNALPLINVLNMPAIPSHLMLRPWSVITYMFAHENVWHILFNMLWLYYLGGIFQEYLGNSKVLKAYILGGLGGGIVFLAGMNFIPVLRDSPSYAVAMHGASGAVMALIVGIATLLPNYQIRLFIFDIRLKYIALFMVGLSFMNMIGGNPGGNLAHLGGALAGFIYIRQLSTHTLLDRIGNQLMKIRFLGLGKKPNELKIHRTYTTHMKVEKPQRPNQEEIDLILDKISKSGYDSLTRSEREILFQASHDQS